MPRAGPLHLLALVVLAFAAATGVAAVGFTCATSLATTSYETAIGVPPDGALELDEGVGADLQCTDAVDAIIYTLDCPQALYLQTVPKDQTDFAFIALIPPAAVASGACLVSMQAVSKAGVLAPTPLPLGHLVESNPLGIKCNISVTPDSLEFANPTYLPRRESVFPVHSKSLYVLPYATHHLACDESLRLAPPMFLVPATLPPATTTGTLQSHTVDVPLDSRLLNEHQETHITLRVASTDGDSVLPPASEEQPVKDSLKGMFIAILVFAVGTVIGLAVYRHRAVSDHRRFSESSGFRGASSTYQPNSEDGGYGTLL